MQLTPEQNERLKSADEALELLFAEYRVELCYDEVGDYFFVLAESIAPSLKLVQ